MSHASHVQRLTAWPLSQLPNYDSPFTSPHAATSKEAESPCSVRCSGIPCKSFRSIQVSLFIFLSTLNPRPTPGSDLGAWDHQLAWQR